jgi:hypothetical protein
MTLLDLAWGLFLGPWAVLLIAGRQIIVGGGNGKLEIEVMEWLEMLFV